MNLELQVSELSNALRVSIERCCGKCKKNKDMTNLLTRPITVSKCWRDQTYSTVHPTQEPSDGKTHSASSLAVITVRPAAEPTTTPSWQNTRDVTEGQNRPSWPAAVAVRQKREIKPIRFSDGGLGPFFTPPRQSETGSSPVSESCLPWVHRDKNTYPDDQLRISADWRYLARTAPRWRPLINHWHEIKWNKF